MYRYLLLADQPLTVRFEFTTLDKPEWNPDGSHNRFENDQHGFCQLIIQIADRMYGPYQTAIRTTYGDWSGRKSCRPSPASLLLRHQLGDLSERLHNKWEWFDRKGKELTGEMVLELAGLRIFQVAEGGALYAV